jgi:hypothetical protein
MPKFPHVFVGLSLAALIGIGPSRAYDEGPWCAVVSVGKGSAVERCHFRDLESCRLEVVSGNRGFCNHNPRWIGDPFSPAAKKRRPRARSRR